jgi:hypothetical protein
MMVGDEAGAKGIQTLITTGYAFQLPREDLIRYEYLLRPLRRAELSRAIERALARKLKLITRSTRRFDRTSAIAGTPR